jgi:phosphodiesterase/alkaline phosphatase D-like protein
MRTTEGPGGRRLSRAEFLRLSGATATAALLGTGELQSGRAYAAPSFTADPFSLGVASGDPEHNSVVLWTRLAPEPLATDGHGGMPPDPVTVRYEVATDHGFRQRLFDGIAERGAENVVALDRDRALRQRGGRAGTAPGIDPLRLDLERDRSRRRRARSSA